MSLAEQLVQFAFIPLVCIAMVAGAVVGLFAVGALFDALDHPEALAEHIDGLFHAPLAPARPLAVNHYYQPHWREKSS